MGIWSRIGVWLRFGYDGGEGGEQGPKEERHVRVSAFRRDALGLYAAMALLAGCGGSQQSGAQSPLGQLPEGLVDTRTSDAAQTGFLAVRPDRGPSWMSPDAASKDLLYVSNYITSEVFVFSYPALKLVGTLTGFDQPDGICTNKAGDVFIVSNQNDTIIVYKHGGTAPIATLAGTAGYPVNCSVDPTTGNLAVATIHTYSDGPGSVAIYAHGKGTPTIYSDSKMTNVYFVGYDDKGNLFLDGATPPSIGFVFAELPKGKKKFSNIKLKGGYIYFPGKVFWDGKYVTVADQSYGGTLDTSGINRTTGAGGKIVSSIPLKGSGDIVDFWIYKGTLIGPDFQDGPENKVLFYKYPAGGKPTTILKYHSFYETIGAAISVAR